MDPSGVFDGRSTTVFAVNLKSGGGRGRLLAQALTGRPGVDVLDLASAGPGRAVAAARAGARLVVCGGDGTVASVLEAANAEALASGQAAVAPAVLALGTGNDLARHLGWPAVEDRSGLDRWLALLPGAAPAPLDRWELVLPDGGVRGWYNYLSWGLDARIALRFDRLRRRRPGLFRLRSGNRLIYVLLGLIDAGAPLALRAEDGRFGPPPPWARVLLLASIPSYAGGGHLGAQVRADDGRCDGFLLGGSLLMGLGTRGLRPPRRLGAWDGLALRLDARTAMQLDGEPSLAAPGLYRVRRAGTVRVLLPAGRQGRA